MEFKELIKDVALTLSEQSPKIAIGIGIAAVIGGTIAACVATVKSKDVIDEANEALEKIQKDEDETVEALRSEKREDEILSITESSKKARRKVYLKTIGKVAINYIGSIVLIVGGICAFCFSSAKWKERYVEAASSLVVVRTAYANLRKNIREKYGEDEERELIYGIKEEKVSETYVDENGELKEKKAAKAKVSKGDLASPYAFKFSDCDEYIFGNDIHNESKLFHQTNDGKVTNVYEQIIKNTCRAQGWINLTEIYSQFGLHRREVELAYVKPGYKKWEDVELIVVPCKTEKMVGGQYRIINDWIIDFKNIKDDITYKEA